jgi:hypothetical protein
VQVSVADDVLAFVELRVDEVEGVVEPVSSEKERHTPCGRTPRLLVVWVEFHALQSLAQQDADGTVGRLHRLPAARDAPTYVLDMQPLTKTLGLRGRTAAVNAFEHDE